MADQTDTSGQPAGSGTAQEVLARNASVELLTGRGIEALIVGQLCRAFS